MNAGYKNDRVLLWFQQ